MSKENCILYCSLAIKIFDILAISFKYSIFERPVKELISESDFIKSIRIIFMTKSSAGST